MIQVMCKDQRMTKIQAFTINELMIQWERQIILIQTGSGGNTQMRQLRMLSLSRLQKVIEKAYWKGYA